MIPEISPGPEMPAPRAIGGQPALLRFELNLPNLITLARLLSVPLAIWLIFDGRYGAAFWVFIGAGCVIAALLAFMSEVPSLRFAHLVMGSVFGGLHLAYGVYLSFTEQRKNER